MKTIIGSAIGVLAIGLILIGVGLRTNASSLPAFPTSILPSTTGAPVAVANTNTLGTASGPVMVNCAPGQRALVRQVSLNGEPVSQVACVADPAAFADSNAVAAPVAQAVAYRTVRPANITGRRVVYQEPAPRRVVQERRSWKKPLLVIGGSAAAGAGIGGLVGGKKGALIGAALGGGVSTIYEATKK